MIKSEGLEKIAVALAKAQGALKAVKKEAENPYYKSAYADLAMCMEEVRKPFADNGISIIQSAEPVEGALVIETMLLHISGQFIVSHLKMPITKQDAQGIGALVSYGRRYGLGLATGLVAEAEDDDAEGTKHIAHEKPHIIPTPKKQEPKNAFLETMKLQAERVGADAYFKVIGGAGFEKAADITDPKTQTAVYNELIKLPNKRI